ncbi:unnamed protein product [Oppiella nova]|uniref:ABC-type xenobiotic transporter n=1 Tax=Oppiella nova TaxID=334625 RepID=A0A7R9LM96_9ACAR|nr:unnamed protein product [Oppiella nova]CAG2164999.1 unnamed protein product [Oppiella nova]
MCLASKMMSTKKWTPNPIHLFHCFNWFLKFASTSDKLLIFIGAFGATLGGISWPVMTILFGDIVDVFVNYEYAYSHGFNNSDITFDDFMNKTYLLSGSLLVIAVLFFVTNFLLIMCFTRAAHNQIHTIRVKYFTSVLKQEISWFDSRPSGDFASRVTADLKRVEDGIGEKLGFAFYHTSASVTNIIIAFIYGWKLTLVVLAMAPLLGTATAIMTKVQATFARKETESYASAGNVAEEVISAIRTVYSFGGESKEIDRYVTNLKPAMKSGIRRNFLTGLGTGLMWLCLYCGFGLGIWYGVKLIILSEQNNDDLYTIGKMVIVFWCVTGCGWNLGYIAPHLEAIQIARGTARSVFDIIERQPLIDISSQKGEKIKNNFETNIEFKGIHFNYPLRPEVKILNDFNLRIKSGETVALVGPSGCGKSTIIQLIQRFYDTNSGDVLIDGKRIKDLNVEWLRQQIGVVGQEPVLFDTSIAENIRLGSKEKTISKEDIERACIEANCHEFIDKLPEKYETYVGDKGAQLSGGQKQRIAIARALISKPKILLLDEATSALDLQSEHLVQSALDRASKGRTTIIVAHRLSTIINSDRIIFIENGKVLESGTHADLMTSKGAYYRLVNTQKSEPKDEKYDNQLETNLLKRSTTVDSDPNSLYGKEVTQEVPKEEEILKEFSQMRLLRLLWIDKIYIVIGLLCSTLFGLNVPAYAFIFGSLVDVFATNQDHDVLYNESVIYAIYFVALGAGIAVTSITQISSFGIASERLTMRLRKQAFSSILRQEIGWFDQQENSTGSLCSRLSSDAANIQGASGSRMSVISQAVSTFLASCIFGFVFNWKLSLLTLAFMPFIIFSVMLSMRIVSKLSTTDKEATEQASKIAIEAISGIRTVVSLNQEKYFLQKYTQVLDDKIGLAKRRCIWNGLALGVAEAMPMFSYSAAFLYGGILASRGEIKSGDFFKIIETMIYGAMVIGQSVIFTSDYQKAKISAQNMFRLIDRQPLNQTNNNITPKEKPNECLGELSFRGIHFFYPNRREVSVLNGLSFKARKGETVALVGSSGCGKSTSIQLLERFYECAQGKIVNKLTLLDGNDIRNLDTQWLRSQMALVSQEPILFSYNIRDNIAYGDNSRFVAMDEVVEAASKANIHEFIKDLPHGFCLSPNRYIIHKLKGTQLSGGQKQRIAIARALVRDPKILLLDEATSALDSNSEKLVQKALDEASKGRTCIVIAHRLTTIQNADRIIVMQKGVSIEEGRHHELLENRGAYHQLYSVQTE